MPNPEHISNGIQELEQWLIDLIDHGLSNPQLNSDGYWQHISRHMNDAGLRGISYSLEHIQRLVSQQHENSNREVLDRLAELYSLVCAYQQFEKLPAVRQADLEQQFGFTTRQTDLKDEARYRDIWQVLDISEYAPNYVATQTVWLQGLHTHLYAYIQQSAVSRNYADTFDTNQCYHGDLSYYPSGWPLRALLNSKQRLNGRPVHLRDGLSIDDLFSLSSQAFAVQPWLKKFPITLGKVQLHYQDSQPNLIDQAGNRLPLVYFPGNMRYRLEKETIDVFGSYDGRRFVPLVAQHQDRLHPLGRK